VKWPPPPASGLRTKSVFFWFLGVGWDRVHLARRPIVPASNDRWWWMWWSQWNENWQGKSKYSEKSCPNATLSTTNPTWPEQGSNRGRRSGKRVTNRLSYGTAIRRSRWAFRVLLVRNEKVNDVLRWFDCLRIVKLGWLRWTRHVYRFDRETFWNNNMENWLEDWKITSRCKMIWNK
jgi:hypothetical protein